MLVPPHFLVSTTFKKMRWKDEFRKWLPKLSIYCQKIDITTEYCSWVEMHPCKKKQRNSVCFTDT